MIANISLIINTLEAYIVRLYRDVFERCRCLLWNDDDDDHNIVEAKCHFVTLVRDVTFRRGEQILRDPAARQKEYRIT